MSRVMAAMERLSQERNKLIPLRNVPGIICVVSAITASRVLLSG